MKLLVRDYLASLKEREELDAILPDLLSELGFTVYSRPQRGTVQHGVDIAAVGEDDNGERKVFLFSVKKGDLTRQDWDGTPQALRASLNEIQDSYIPNRIPPEYQNLKIVICLTFGGDVHEQVRDSLTGFTKNNTTERITYSEWNGDKIASLILKGILREEILPKPMRSSFQKAVAMVDEPDVAYQYFARLAMELRRAGTESAKARTRSARQLNICLWILFVWARDIGNLEAPYRVSELVLLSVWELLRPTIGTDTKEAKELLQVVLQVIELHIIIASEFLENKVIPYAGIRHGISMSIGSQSALDVNLALFEILGRISLTGLWLHWLVSINNQDVEGTASNGVQRFFQTGLSLIHSNPTLMLPITDRQSTDIALFLQLWLVIGTDPKEVIPWLKEVTHRLIFAIRTRGRYPSSSSDYRVLAEHPRDQSDECFKDATVGSTLIPVLVAWLQALGQEDEVQLLRSLVQKELEHCTLQLWMPDATSEAEMYIGGSNHGCALCDLPVGEGGSQLLATIAKVCDTDTVFNSLSPIQTNFWPVILVACRHHQLPIPPGFWIRALMPSDDIVAKGDPAKGAG